MPEVTEYKKSVKAGKFATLGHLKPVMRGVNPHFAAGNFGAVFKLQEPGTTNLFAVKTFRLDNPGRRQRFQAISDDLKTVAASSLVEFDFLQSEIEIINGAGQSEYWPVLKMAWLTGDSLDKALDNACRANDVTAIHDLHQQFECFVEFLENNGLGHGDLKGGNLILGPGCLVGLDLDGMYTPSLAGQLGTESGTPDFQHPKRTTSEFSEKMDWFSIRVMRVAFLALKKNTGLWGKHLDDGNMLFRKRDFMNPSNSPVFTDLRSLADPEIDAILDEIEESLATGDIEGINVNPRWPIKPAAATAQPQPTPVPVQPAPVIPTPTPVVPPPPPQPVAAFAALGSIGIAPLIVRFINQSRGATSYHWDLGNGNTSDQKNPTEVYDQDGVYDVILTVTGPGGTDTFTLPALVQVQAPAPVVPPPNASFGMTWVGTATAPLTVQLAGPTANITSCLWTFGNGQSSLEPNPTVTFPEGAFTITLEVEGPGGSDQATKTLKVAKAPKVKTPKPPGQQWYNFPTAKAASRGTKKTVAAIGQAAKPKLSYKWLYGAFVAALLASLFLK